MLQPRILVGSHRTDQQQQQKHSTKIDRRIYKKTSKMCEQNEHLTTTKTQTIASNPGECGIKRRQTTHRSARLLSPALNITSSMSLHNLATFLILAITLYSTTICMAQLSGEYMKKKILFYSIDLYGLINCFPLCFKFVFTHKVKFLYLTRK